MHFTFKRFPIILILLEYICIVLLHICLFCVFTVTLSKIKVKEDKYTKILAKNQTCAIIHKRDIRKNVLPKFIKLCMETPCLCPFQGHKYGRRKPTETSVFEFSYLCVNSSLEELIKIKAIFILRQGMFR